MFNLGMKFLKLYKALCILHVRQGLCMRKHTNSTSYGHAFQSSWFDRDNQPRWLMKPKAHASCLQKMSHRKKRNKLLRSGYWLRVLDSYLLLFQQGSGSCVPWSSPLHCLGVCVCVHVHVRACALLICGASFECKTRYESLLVANKDPIHATGIHSGTRMQWNGWKVTSRAINNTHQLDVLLKLYVAVPSLFEKTKCSLTLRYSS